MSSIEERKKNRLKNIIDTALNINPITGIAKKASKLLAGALTPEKEDALDNIISDLKAEEKSEMIKNIKKNMTPAKMPEVQDDPRDNYPQFFAKGGKVKSKKTKNKTTKKKTNDARAIAKKYFKGTF